MILLPEQKIKYLIDFLLEHITEEYLYRIFGDSVFGDGYSYYDNARSLLLREKDSPRKLSSNIFFNRDRQGLPTIHIALNQDILGEGNGLGYDLSEIPQSEGFGYFTEQSRVYSARFNIMCTSDNSFEVLIIYNVLRCLVQGNIRLLEGLGLMNAKLSGQDLILTDYLMPSTIFARGFMIDCLYQLDAPGLELQEGVADAFVSCVCGRKISVND